MSTPHHQPLWLSLRNTNQLSAPDSPTLSLSSLPSSSPTLSLALLFSARSLLLTENKCCITILILTWVCRFCLSFFFLPVMYGASSEELAQTEGSRERILMTSARRKWGEEVCGESALNLPLSSSASCSLSFSHLWTHHAASLCLQDLSPFDCD